MLNYITRTHKIHISKYNKYFKTIDSASLKAKNLYNAALYLERQQYFNNQPFINNFTLYKLLKGTDAFNELHDLIKAEPQEVLKQVYQDITSFKQAIKSYNNNPEKFKSKPKLPNYKHKIDGRSTLKFSYIMFNIQNNQININSLDIHIDVPKYLKGMTSKKQQTNIYLDEEESPLELISIRIVPVNDEYNIELIYTKQIELQDSVQRKQAASIDLGINNLITLTTTLPNTQPLLISGRYLKSYNKNFNKKLAFYKSQAKQCQNKDITHRINSLYKNRNHYFNTNMHQIASYIINYLTKNKINILVVGYNQQWKQNSKLSKKTNQTFIQIPYTKLIQILQYKCYENNIILKRVNEAYTSGTSFLDSEPPSQEYYNKTRRVHRGLFKTNQGIRVNADVNASYQILRVYATAFNNKPEYQLKVLNPIVIKPPNITEKLIA